MASKIVALMSTHIHYVEPFAGGLSVLLAKNPEGVSEVVNDLNYELTNFWRVLQNVEWFSSFKRIVDAIPFSESEFNRPLDLPWPSGCGVEQAAINCACRFFVSCRQSLAGRMKDFATLSRRRVRREMNEQASAWLSAIEGLPEVHERLKRVVILNRDALDVIRQQDGPDTMFYCDPPYKHDTRATTGEYEHEMTDDQHYALLTVLSEIKGKFLLSGYRSEMYDDAALQFGWKRHDFDIANNAAGGKSKKRMTECVWANC